MTNKVNTTQQLNHLCSCCPNIMRKTVCFIFLLSLSSCLITNTPGFYSGYKKLAPEDKRNIVFVTEKMDICSKKNEKIIFSITAAHLLKCLQEIDSSIVYFWSPNCSSKSCVLLSAAQEYCDRNNYQLFVITEYYDFKKSTSQSATSRPIYSINQGYYKTDYCNKYVKLFTQELIKNKKLGKNNFYYRYYLFSKDSIVSIKQELFDK